MPLINVPQKKILIDSKPEQSLMSQLMDAKLPVASSCGGKGICGKCRVQILSGIPNLTPVSELEALTSKRNNLDEFERLSCQCKVHGDIEVATRYW